MDPTTAAQLAAVLGTQEQKGCFGGAPALAYAFGQEKENSSQISQLILKYVYLHSVAFSRAMFFDRHLDIW